MTTSSNPAYERDARIALAQGRLMARVCAFNACTPTPMVRPSAITVEAVFAEARAIAQQALALSEELGLAQPSASEFAEAFPTYSEFCAREREIEASLAEIPIEPFIRLSADAFLVPFDAFGTILAQVPPGNPPVSAAGFRKWFAKFLAALGFGDVATSLFALLEGDAASALALTRLGKAIAGFEWAVIKKYLGILLELIFSKAFLAKLAEKIGETVLAKILGKVMAKCLPFVGWALLIGQIVWAIGEQFV